MADFLQAYRLTMKNEGDYSLDPDDAGGETYRGISRSFHPSWKGWDLLDNLKKESGDIPAVFNADVDLQVKVHDFYKTSYWDKFHGDHIPDQAIASELFDTSVNLGVRRAVSFLQDGLNVLNRNGTLYNDIAVDGDCGPDTLLSLKSYLNTDDSDYLVKIMNILQGAHYINYMKHAPSQEKYARGWLKRVSIF